MRATYSHIDCYDQVRNNYNSSAIFSRVGSAKGKLKANRKSDQDVFEENPYRSEIMDKTATNFYTPDDDNMINITTEEELNKTDNAIRREDLARENGMIDLSGSQEYPFRKSIKGYQANKNNKRRIFSSSAPRK